MGPCCSEPCSWTSPGSGSRTSPARVIEATGRHPSRPAAAEWFSSVEGASGVVSTAPRRCWIRPSSISRTPGREQQIAHPHDGRDACTVFALTAGTAAELWGRSPTSGSAALLGRVSGSPASPASRLRRHRRRLRGHGAGDRPAGADPRPRPPGARRLRSVPRRRRLAAAKSRRRGRCSRRRRGSASSTSRTPSRRPLTI